jgi:hypothetical protein
MGNVNLTSAFFQRGEYSVVDYNEPYRQRIMKHVNHEDEGTPMPSQSWQVPELLKFAPPRIV